MQIALVHMLFNIFAVLVIFGLPFLRDLPIYGAEMLGALASERKIYAAAWIVGVFLLLPLLLIAITTSF
jgi:sodium-dependent phosphate cotransporter